MRKKVTYLVYNIIDTDFILLTFSNILIFLGFLVLNHFTGRPFGIVNIFFLVFFVTISYIYSFLLKKYIPNKPQIIFPLSYFLVVFDFLLTKRLDYMDLLVQSEQKSITNFFIDNVTISTFCILLSMMISLRGNQIFDFLLGVNINLFFTTYSVIVLLVSFLPNIPALNIVTSINIFVYIVGNILLLEKIQISQCASSDVITTKKYRNDIYLYLVFLLFNVIFFFYFYKIDNTSLIIISLILWFLGLFIFTTNKAQLIMYSLFCCCMTFYVFETILYRVKFRVWLHPYSYPRGDYIQSFFGLRSGGLGGTGLGSGMPYLVHKPLLQYIFAPIGEELGLSGLFAIVTILLIFVIKYVQNGLKISPGFQQKLVIMVGILFGLRFLTCLLILTNYIPSIDVTVPFLSYNPVDRLCDYLLLGLSFSAFSAQKKETLHK